MKLLILVVLALGVLSVSYSIGLCQGAWPEQIIDSEGWNNKVGGYRSGIQVLAQGLASIAGIIGKQAVGQAVQSELDGLSPLIDEQLDKNPGEGVLIDVPIYVHSTTDNLLYTTGPRFVGVGRSPFNVGVTSLKSNNYVERPPSGYRISGIESYLLWFKRESGMTTGGRIDGREMFWKAAHEERRYLNALADIAWSSTEIEKLRARADLYLAGVERARRSTEDELLKLRLESLAFAYRQLSAARERAAQRVQQAQEAAAQIEMNQRISDILGLATTGLQAAKANVDASRNYHNTEYMNINVQIITIEQDIRTNIDRVDPALGSDLPSPP